TTFDAFSSQVAIQLNDTHPAVAVAELMRVLIDENDLPCEQAWAITQATLGYTNHTLLPEALEKWSVALFEHVLPRHLQIINEINRRCLAQLLTDTIGAAWITDLDVLTGLEPLAQDAGFQQEFLRIKRVNKAWLAVVIRELTRVSVDPETLFDVQVKRMHEYKRQLLNVLHIVHA